MNTMSCVLPKMIYTIHADTLGVGKRPSVRLTGPFWRLKLGIDHLEFTSQRAAAYFAQHHAAGLRDPLRLIIDGVPCGERPIPRVSEIPVPAAHQDTGADFLPFFLSWPVEKPKPAAPGETEPRVLTIDDMLSGRFRTLTRPSPALHPATPG
jgi:hypothetical protein